MEGRKAEIREGNGMIEKATGAENVTIRKGATVEAERETGERIETKTTIMIKIEIMDEKRTVIGIGAGIGTEYESIARLNITCLFCSILIAKMEFDKTLAVELDL
ncbi:hypothetical protein SLA2020_090760 [Shorea laevis]